MILDVPLFIAIGITSENLLIAALVVDGVGVTGNRRWLLIPLLLFITRNAALLWGKSLGGLMLPRLSAHRERCASGLISSGP